MPISPERQKLYPGGSIRSLEWLNGYRAPILERAGNRCEGTLQRPNCRAENGKEHPETGSIVVLTVAHLDQDPSNNDWANLAALCQRCHNLWDSLSRTRNAAATRWRKHGAGTLDLFACEAIPAPAEDAPPPPPPESPPPPELEPAPKRPGINAERLKAKIAGLRAKTMEAGCTEAEATAAAEMAARLMADHGLSEEELVMTEASFPESSSRANWRIDLAGTVATVTNTAVILDRGALTFLGRTPGPEIAAYLQELCVRAVERERRAFQESAHYRARRKASTRRAASNDFTEAMVHRLRQRLLVLFRPHRDAKASAEASRWLDTRFPDRRTLSRSERKERFHEASEHGRAAGDRTRLDPGLSTDREAPQRLNAPTSGKAAP